MAPSCFADGAPSHCSHRGCNQGRNDCEVSEHLTQHLPAVLPRLQPLRPFPRNTRLPGTRTGMRAPCPHRQDPLPPVRDIERCHPRHDPRESNTTPNAEIPKIKPCRMRKFDVQDERLPRFPAPYQGLPSDGRPCRAGEDLISGRRLQTLSLGPLKLRPIRRIHALGWPSSFRSRYGRTVFPAAPASTK